MSEGEGGLHTEVTKSPIEMVCCARVIIAEVEDIAGYDKLGHPLRWRFVEGVWCAGALLVEGQKSRTLRKLRSRSRSRDSL